MTGYRLASGGFRGRVGLARRDVTPPAGIRNRNWGPATTDVAAGVHRPFTLTALALQGDGQPVLIVAVDATWWRRVADYAGFRDAVLPALGLAEEQLLFCLSHTHAGAVLSAEDADLKGGHLIPDYLLTLREAAIEAGREAIRTAEDAIVEWGTGRCGLAANRDLDLDGRALVGFNPTQPADDTVLVGRVSRSDGTTLATVVNYACHPTTLAWQNQKLSPDYVGAMRQTVEEATGAPCLFLQGASGDLAPREQYTGEESVADRHGAALGHAVLATLAGMPPPATVLRMSEVVESGAPLAVWKPTAARLSGRLTANVIEAVLPLRALPSLADLEIEWADIDPRSRAERLRRARSLREGYIGDGQTVVKHPIWTVHIGDAVLVAHPGEAYSRFQQELRRQHPDYPIVVANLTNGPGFVYLPDDDAYRRNAYQAWQTPLAPGALDALTTAASDAVTTLIRP